MIKQNFNIDREEVLRILSLHETATKNHYLINEQQEIIKKLEPKKFTLPNNTFPSGEFKNFDRNAVDGVVKQLNDYLKGFPLNQKIEVEVESSESRVPNRGVGLDPGELSQKRGEELEKFLKGKLPQNVSIKLKSLGAQGPAWKRPQNATPEQIRRLANDPKYTQYQYVSFNVVGSGESKEILCDVGFVVTVDYRKEWCKPGVDESKCHKCDQAVFYMWANDIPLTTQDGAREINLNNNQGSEASGPSRVVKLVVSLEQKNQILSKNPEEILITYGCALRDCHSDPAHITIVNDAGQILLPPMFITTGGRRMSNTEPPVKLLKLNKCGQKISAAGDPGMGVDVAPPRPKKTPEYRYDGTIESLFELYKMVGPDGIFTIPQEKLDFFRKYSKFNKKPWQAIVDSLQLSNKDLRQLERMKKNQPQ